MRKNKNIILHNVRVEDYAAEGKSLARVDGKVIFIERAVPGDLVDVRLKKNKKDWAEGYPITTHEFSKDRVTPFCQHFGVCGGCQWQMLPYEKQLQYKQRQVEDALKRIGKVQLPPISQIIGASETRYYRNKLEYTFSTKEFSPEKPEVVGEDPGTKGASGFHARGFFDKVVEIETCYLQPEPTNLIRNTIAAFARENGFLFYDHRLHTGFLRNAQVRICTTGEIMVNVVFAQDDRDRINMLLDHLLLKVPQITTLLYTINTKWNDSLNDLEPVTYFGKGYIIEKLENYQFKIGPTSFFQTNSRQAEQLYKVAREFAELKGTETVYDLYCGTGSIGIFVSKNARKIVGVEMIDAAIQDARENAALNDIRHAEFFTGDVAKICDDEFFELNGRPDVVITDPPRAGMHEKLVQKILDIAAPIVVYVSCNPATQARDIGLLNSKYQVTKIQPVDMFPHTLHIENVIQLKLK